MQGGCKLFSIFVIVWQCILSEGMSKKLAAHSFIFIASIILLAHAVVPHHHHQGIACVEPVCCHDNLAHKHDTPADSHQHDSDGSADCLLRQIIVVSNHDKNEIDCIFCPHNHSVDLNFFLPYAGNEAIIPIFKRIASAPDASFSFSSYISTSFGLRAPPAA